MSQENIIRDIVRRAFQRFETETRILDDVNYVAALEEMIELLESSLNAKKEEMQE